MMIHEIMKLLDDKENFEKVSKILASGDYHYAYPFQMRELLKKYAKLVLDEKK